MNTLDYVMLSIVALGLLLGYFRGFIAQIVSISGFVLAYLVAFYFYRDFAPLLRNAVSLPTYQNYQKYEFIVKGLNLDTYILNALAFAILFFGVKFALVIIGRALNISSKNPRPELHQPLERRIVGLSRSTFDHHYSRQCYHHHTLRWTSKATLKLNHSSIFN